MDSKHKLHLAFKTFAVLIAAAILASGCKPPDSLRPADLDDAVPTAPNPQNPESMAFSAGVPVQSKPAQVTPVVVVARANPFALTPVEAAFDQQQAAAFLATNEVAFPLFYQAPPENLAPPEVEPQPYRRLAGILIGDSVTALIDMGNGHIEEIHPGEIIPGTQWMVTSIDSEKAVLTRVGSNRLPHQVVVRLESAPANETPQQPAGGVPQGGAPRGGPQGGNPYGFGGPQGGYGRPGGFGGPGRGPRGGGLGGFRGPGNP